MAFGLGSGLGGSSSSTQAASWKDIQSDIQLPNGPSDSVSSLSFSPVADFLAVGSWDSSVRIYEASNSPSGKASYNHEGPVLDVCWSKDGSKVLSGGTDKAGRMYDVQSGKMTQVAAHEGAVKAVRWVDQQNGLLATGSWDKTIKYWDLRQQAPVLSVPLEDRLFCMDVAGQLLVAATADRKIQTFSLSNPGTPYEPTRQSPLKFQTRSLACLPDQTGYAIGSVEARVGIQYINPELAANSFSFKCHRVTEAKPAPSAFNNAASGGDTTQLHSVNAISFHPVTGTFATAGSDGTFSFWDKKNRTRLKTIDLKPSDASSKPSSVTSTAPEYQQPITCTAYNNINGSRIFAYAVSYDWSKGYKGMLPNHANRIMLHPLKDEEVLEKPGNK